MKTNSYKCRYGFFRFLGCPLDVLGDMDSDKAIRSIERKCGSETLDCCFDCAKDILKIIEVRNAKKNKIEEELSYDKSKSLQSTFHERWDGDF